MTSGLQVPHQDVRDPRTVQRPGRPPVIWFAALGGLIVVVSTWLLIAWISGPNFASVPVGPDRPPGWMLIALNSGQFGLPIVAAVLLYCYLVRPWIRARTVAYDGLVCVAATAASVWDPLSVAVQPWFAYNSYLLNYGNPLGALPGWTSLNEPGRAIAWSFPALPAFYAVSFPLIGIIGCAILRSAKRAFPRLNGFGLAIVCFLAMATFDVILEGITFMPLGYWTYAGGSFPLLFSGHYYQLPANHLFHVTATMVGLVFLRYSVNDRGQSIVERGIDRFSGGALKLAVIRLLAVVAGIHIIVVALFHLPQTFWAINSHAWPKDVTDRSYFQNQCGQLVDRACPGPGVPIGRPDSGYVDWAGHYVGRPAR